MRLLVRKYIKIWKTFFSNSLTRDMEFKANFIETQSTEIGANETKSNEIKILLAAKEVRVIDEYSTKFNLSISFKVSYPATQQVAFPEVVNPANPLSKTSALPTTALKGNPPPKDFPSKIKSASTL